MAQDDSRAALIAELEVKRVLRRYPAISMFVHPWGSKRCCVPECSATTRVTRVLGCQKCWHASKAWATVATFGTDNTFDMVARDRSKRV